MSSRDFEGFSTSALAKRLQLPIQQLFATLRDYGWIERRADTWMLTAKGEFEGGQYHTSKRYGRYIVWPSSLAEHPLLLAIESNQRITGAALCRYYPHLRPREVNRALAELGLQQHTLLGWELTPLGRHFSGQQEESDDSGSLYVSWPHEIIDDPVVHRELSRHSAFGAPPVDDSIMPDLFSSGAQAEARGYPAVDGHCLNTPLQMQVCNWLYLAQLAHAHRRALPTEEDLVADFYLPGAAVYIDCWEENVPAMELSGRLRKRECYDELKLRYLEVNARDAERLDELIGRRLLAYGVRY
ncbi:hypothetical protein [Chromatocurvus halotolerans]|uniref:Uncharacterized protein n=1 Tax=Chromatocurvus halotolerans TaxID=1132028 RepID=A0A4R2KN57_9GAMM|nr:hypothetical protein [Chromatocurvus halotolerans]TCO72226.1 hypothetical protein EV688_11927 [Chromatocurvus halotolerans]